MPLTDFQPVGMMTESPRVAGRPQDLPANNLQEFIAWLKANETRSPVRLGRRRLPALTFRACCFNLAIGVNITHVPYRGEAPVMQDLIGGRIDYMCATIQTGAGAGQSRLRSKASQ